MLKIILSVCSLKGGIKPKGNEIYKLKYIKCLKAGILKYDSKYQGEELWVLEDKPIIKFMYYE